MKTQIQLSCIDCRKPSYVSILLSDYSPRWKCDSCGELNVGVFDGSITMGLKLFCRSQYEINETKDYNLSIVFSAMAVDCELSRLFIKWTTIDDLGKHQLNERFVYEKMLAKFRGIKEKLKGVIITMHPNGTNPIFDNNNIPIQQLSNSIPGINKQTFYNLIDEHLFWKRNRIIHLGDSSFEKEDASDCLNISKNLLDILKELDSIRKERFDKERNKK